MPNPPRLARLCWTLTLLTEAFRVGPVIALCGPLGRFQAATPAAEEVLALVPATGFDQLAEFRAVFKAELLPRVADRRGPWTLGLTFTGSKLLHADADLIAAGLPLDLKTTAKPAFALTDMLQFIGCALLDFDDTCRHASRPRSRKVNSAYSSPTVTLDALGSPPVARMHGPATRQSASSVAYRVGDEPDTAGHRLGGVESLAMLV